MDALIVGSGDVGRWIADVLDCSVAFSDVDTAVAEAAAEEIGERARAVGLEAETVHDVVIVAVPMGVTTETIRAQAPRARTAMVDLTGSMQEPLAAMDRAGPDLERASFHPLFAPEHAPGRIAVSEGANGPTVDRIRDRLVAAGNTLVDVEPTAHDEAMKTIQGRAHAAILAFGLAAEEVPEDLATPVFEELQALRERVTTGTPGVYADIQAAFDGAADVESAAARLASADRTEFEALYQDAG